MKTVLVHCGPSIGRKPQSFPDGQVTSGREGLVSKLLNIPASLPHSCGLWKSCQLHALCFQFSKYFVHVCDNPISTLRGYYFLNYSGEKTETEGGFMAYMVFYIL